VHTKAASRWIHLLPGAQHEWRIVFRKRPVRWLRRPYRVLAPDSEMILDSEGGYFDVRHPGRFQAIAILEQPESLRALPGCADGGTCWTGRAVSAPVALELRGP
jgi:hypothetical protein